jgi:hypothetical protein
MLAGIIIALLGITAVISTAVVAVKDGYRSVPSLPRA